MMVASTPAIKLEQPHHLEFTNNSPVSEMAYHFQSQNNGQCFNQNSVFTTPVNSYNHHGIDPRYAHPAASSTYRGSLESSRMNDNGAFSLSPVADSFYTNSNNNYPVSPTEENSGLLERRPASQMISKAGSGKNCGLPRSPTQISPPPKRLTTGSPTEANPPISTDADMLPRYSNSLFENRSNTANVDMLSSHCFVNAKPVAEISKAQDFLNAPSSDYFKSTYTVQSEMNGGEEIPRPSSPSSTRHLSQSSTHSSSSSSTPKATTPGRTPSKSSKTPTKQQQAQQLPNFFFGDDDDDSWKICQVCGDKATGYHFNALTCEGCKGFFRRSMKNEKSFNCPYSGNCTITKSNRRQCQSCRLDKCLRIGMKKECIMSRTEIQMKKNLMLNNRIKKNILEWRATEFSPEKRDLVEGISKSHMQTNQPPQIEDDRIVTKEVLNPNSSPDSCSTGSGFSDLINRMTQDIVATAPGQTGASKAHMEHFSGIMEYSIKEIIKFCKKIPTFTTLSLKDQITLLKSGCTEILFIKANYTYDKEQEALACGPGKFYTKESFILGGMSEEYTDCYLKFHHDLSHMSLDDTELACMCAATLFSSDRDELENRGAVEKQQEEIVTALQAYSENAYRCRLRFPKIMAFLTRLRTLNWHISLTLQKLQHTESANHITPLVLEVLPTI